jgi:hypothetical protein
VATFVQAISVRASSAAVGRGTSATGVSGGGGAAARGPP